MALKVLHLSSERTWRGGEQQIAYLIDELRRMGVTVFIAVKTGSEFEKYCIDLGLPCYSLPFRNSMDVGTALRIKKICDEVKPDVVHLHSSKSHGVAVLSAVLGNKVPMVLSRRVDFVPKKSWVTRFKYKHPSIKKIICVSDKITEIISEYTGTPEKVLTVHSGVDLAKFSARTGENILRREYDVDAQTFILGNTSAMEGHKDYFTFLDTIALLIERKLPVKAFVIGRGSLETELKGYAAQKGLGDVVHFTGFRRDITKVLPSLDLFLITSNEEGLGTSVLDAFAAGVPVVGTAAGGIPEMIINDVTGLLAPVGDSASLASAVEHILTTPSLRERLVNGAKKKVEAFSKELTASKTVRVYEDITKAPARH